MRKGSSIYRLDLVLDDGILRLGGHVRRIAMPEERNTPPFWPKTTTCPL